MKTFEPRFDVLPQEQKALWPELRAVPPAFVLYGGTALALRLGHRVSVDFDFFSSEPFELAGISILSCHFVAPVENCSHVPFSHPGRESIRSDPSRRHNCVDGLRRYVWLRL